MNEENLFQTDLFMSEGELIERAYDQRGSKIAYRENSEEAPDGGK
jgi:hypothetical protein